MVLRIRKHFRTSPDAMHPAFSHLLTGLLDTIGAADQGFERAFEVFSEMNPVVGVYVQPLENFRDLFRNTASLVITQDPSGPQI